MEIPAQINGQVVVAIGNSAFGNQTQISQITIPASVASIGEGAFFECVNLDSVTFASGSELKTIGEFAFLNCRNLKSIVIPSSVTIIEMGAFGICNGLESITFEQNSKLSSIGFGAFYECVSLQTIRIPVSVTSISQEAFKNCTNLTTVYAERPSSLSVPCSSSGIFENCSALTAIYVPDLASVTAYRNAQNWLNYASAIRTATQNPPLFLWNPQTSFTLTQGQYYSIILDSASLNANYMILGALPNGVSFNPVTRTSNGTPTTAGWYSFRIQAICSASGQVVERYFSITILSSAYVIDSGILFDPVSNGELEYTLYSDGRLKGYVGFSSGRYFWVGKWTLPYAFTDLEVIDISAGSGSGADAYFEIDGNNLLIATTNQSLWFDLQMF